MLINFKDQVQTVTEITRSIKGILESGFAFVAISGEVSNLRKPYSGHLYFTLKDNQSQIRAVLFKTQSRYLTQAIKDGDQIICRGRISVYEARGEYQVIVDSVDFAGSGALQMAFERLKQELAAQGLFDEAHKKSLPFLPQRIALITSPQGAAVHDFLKIAARRFPAVPIEIYPALMQGGQAAAEIINALQLVHARQTCDLIVICRGGGSIEDLCTFNDEQLARAVYAADIPVVSAIGHEIDFTILDFVADYRAPTPTAAAEAVLPDRLVIGRQIAQSTRAMTQAIKTKIAGLRRQVESQTRLLATPAHALQAIRVRTQQARMDLSRHMANQLIAKAMRVDSLLTELHRHSPQHVITRHRDKITGLRQRLETSACLDLERKSAALQKAAALLNAVSPLAILGRGYAIARTLPDMKVLRSSRQVDIGARLDLRLHDGSLECEVIKK